MKTQTINMTAAILFFSLMNGCGSEETNSNANSNPNLTANTNQTSFQALTQFTMAERDGLLTDTGFLNGKGKTLFVYGRVQLSGTTTCKTADLQLQMNAQSPWIRLQHFFVEGIPNSPHGAGVSFATQFFLPSGARVRVKADVNPNCRTGGVFLGGDVMANGPAEQDIYDWSFTNAQ